jgi:excisionase family DNA binding protein
VSAGRTTHIVALNLSAEKCLKFSSLFSAGPAPQFRPRSVEYERGSGKMRKSSRIAPASVGILAVSPAEAGRLAGIGRTTIYHAISSGDLKSLKIGARRLVAVEALREWLLKHEVRQ